MNGKTLDQFFTKPKTAQWCWQQLQPLLQKLTNKRTEELFYIEPSAGDGAFYDLLPAHRRIGIDIAPRRADFIGCDFMQWQPTHPNLSHADIIVVGNPPFGHRGDLAVRFIEKASTFADTIAFIVPVIFRRYYIHRRLPQNMRWLWAAPLSRNAFQKPDGQNYSVGAEFQLWTQIPHDLCDLPDKRLWANPPNAHPDFEMWQYNNTQSALKMFSKDFVFAVPCQGWQDYNRRETDAAHCEKHKQWILFRPHTRTAHRRLHDGIDYAALSQQNATVTPGFRKHDVVREYVRLYG